MMTFRLSRLQKSQVNYYLLQGLPTGDLEANYTGDPISIVQDSYVYHVMDKSSQCQSTLRS